MLVGTNISVIPGAFPWSPVPPRAVNGPDGLAKPRILGEGPLGVGVTPQMFLTLVPVVP